MQSEGILNFISLLKKEDDFIKAYAFDEGTQKNVWIIIKETGLEQNIKYMKLYREYKCEDEFNIILFEEDEEQEILEQISYITNYIKLKLEK